MDHVNIVPRFKLFRDLGVRFFISRAQIRERLPGKHNAPTESIVRPIALIKLDPMRRVGLLHQDRKIQPRRPATNDVDLH